MSIEAHRCNEKDCDGFVVFENADFDFNDIPTDEKVRCYAFDNPTCNVCEKEFLVIPYYIVVDITDKDMGGYEQLESACMTEVDRQRRTRL
jgi:hypothetical protein